MEVLEFVPEAEVAAVYLPAKDFGSPISKPARELTEKHWHAESGRKSPLKRIPRSRMAFGLVAFPVQLHTAARSQAVNFHQLCRS
jgi:non-homologous end joining protein Ku